MDGVLQHWPDHMGRIRAWLHESRSMLDIRDACDINAMADNARIELIMKLAKVMAMLFDPKLSTAMLVLLKVG